MDRDTQVHRLTARLRTLRRFGWTCASAHRQRRRPRARLHRATWTHGQQRASAAPRLALTCGRAVFRRDPCEPDGPVEPTQIPLDRGRISDYWDEVFTADAFEGHAALDDQSAFIASLGSGRSPQMRDVLATIAADQDAVIRADRAAP